MDCSWPTEAPQGTEGRGGLRDSRWNPCINGAWRCGGCVVAAVRVLFIFFRYENIYASTAHECIDEDVI
jgi:hypothetical protein